MCEFVRACVCLCTSAPECLLVCVKHASVLALWTNAYVRAACVLFQMRLCAFKLDTKPDWAEERALFDPQLRGWRGGSWSMSALLRLHFPSVSFLFFPLCQAQTLKTSTLIGPSQWELLFRRSNCDPRCQPGLALTECLQTNSTIVFPPSALSCSSVAPWLPGLSISLHYLSPSSPAWFSPHRTPCNSGLTDSHKTD